MASRWQVVTAATIGKIQDYKQLFITEHPGKRKHVRVCCIECFIATMLEHVAPRAEVKKPTVERKKRIMSLRHCRNVALFMLARDG